MGSIRTLTEEEVLEAVAILVGMSLPQNPDTDFEIGASFVEGTREVEVYVIDPNRPLDA